MNQLKDLFDLISKDFGLSTQLSPPGLISEFLPDGLADFYRYTNGIELPFVEIYPVEKIEKNIIGDWSCFGFDGYFRYCLFNDKGDIDVWDHESGNDPCSAFDSVPEMLSTLYGDFIESNSGTAKVVISCLPETASKPKIVVGLKLVTCHTSSELIKMLDNVPASFECESRSAAIKLVRGLRSQGVACHVSI